MPQQGNKFLQEGLLCTGSYTDTKELMNRNKTYKDTKGFDFHWKNFIFQVPLSVIPLSLNLCVLKISS